MMRDIAASAVAPSRCIRRNASRHGLYASAAITAPFCRDRDASTVLNRNSWLAAAALAWGRAPALAAAVLSLAVAPMARAPVVAAAVGPKVPPAEAPRQAQAAAVRPAN
jgi:hypothetical protein